MHWKDDQNPNEHRFNINPTLTNWNQDAQTHFQSQPGLSVPPQNTGQQDDWKLKETSSYGKKCSAPPITFFDIESNIQLLNECIALTIPVVDCRKHPWYYKKYIRRINTPGTFSVKINTASNFTDKSLTQTSSAHNSNNARKKKYTKNIYKKRYRTKVYYSTDILREIKSRKMSKHYYEQKMKATSELGFSGINLKQNTGLVGLKIVKAIESKNILTSNIKNLKPQATTKGIQNNKTCNNVSPTSKPLGSHATKIPPKNIPNKGDKKAKNITKEEDKEELSNSFSEALKTLQLYGTIIGPVNNNQQPCNTTTNDNLIINTSSLNSKPSFLPSGSEKYVNNFKKQSVTNESSPLSVSTKTKSNNSQKDKITTSTHRHIKKLNHKVIKNATYTVNTNINQESKITPHKMNKNDTSKTKSLIAPSHSYVRHNSNECSRDISSTTYNNQTTESNIKDIKPQATLKERQSNKTNDNVSITSKALGSHVTIIPLKNIPKEEDKESSNGVSEALKTLRINGIIIEPINNNQKQRKISVNDSVNTINAKINQQLEINSHGINTNDKSNNKTTKFPSHSYVRDNKNDCSRDISSIAYQNQTTEDKQTLREDIQVEPSESELGRLLKSKNTIGCVQTKYNVASCKNIPKDTAGSYKQMPALISPRNSVDFSRDGLFNNSSEVAVNNNSNTTPIKPLSSKRSTPINETNINIHDSPYEVHVDPGKSTITIISNVTIDPPKYTNNVYIDNMLQFHDGSQNHRQIPVLSKNLDLKHIKHNYVRTSNIDNTKTSFHNNVDMRFTERDSHGFLQKNISTKYLSPKIANNMTNNNNNTKLSTSNNPASSKLNNCYHTKAPSFEVSKESENISKKSLMNKTKMRVSDREGQTYLQQKICENTKITDNIDNNINICINGNQTSSKPNHFDYNKAPNVSKKSEIISKNNMHINNNMKTSVPDSHSTQENNSNFMSGQTYNLSKKPKNMYYNSQPASHLTHQNITANVHDIFLQTQFERTATNVASQNNSLLFPHQQPSNTQNAYCKINGHSNGLINNHQLNASDRRIYPPNSGEQTMYYPGFTPHFPYSPPSYPHHPTDFLPGANVEISQNLMRSLPNSTVNKYSDNLTKNNAINNKKTNPASSKMSLKTEDAEALLAKTYQSFSDSDKAYILKYFYEYYYNNEVASPNNIADTRKSPSTPNDDWGDTIRNKLSKISQIYSLQTQIPEQSRSQRDLKIDKKDAPRKRHLERTEDEVIKYRKKCLEDYNMTDELSKMEHEV